MEDGMTMPDTIPQTAQPLEDVHLTAARKTLAELPDAADNERPYFWLGRLEPWPSAAGAATGPGGG
jgi:hypothetical protein